MAQRAAARAFLLVPLVSVLWVTGAMAQENTLEGGVSATSNSDDPALEIPFEKFRLQNGLEVILHQDKRIPLVAVSVWYHVGAFDEPRGRSGFAHLFEHLMFQGSMHVPGDQHLAHLEGAGASVRSGMVNGTTNFDRTNYFEVVPKNELELALWLESDRMGWLAAALTQAKLDEQRAVVKNERLQGVENQPYGLAEEQLWQQIFPRDHPYHGAVIGSLADLDAATMADVTAFYDAYYAPANATLAIAGDFESQDAKSLVEKYFGTLPGGARAAVRTITPPKLSSPIRIDVDEPVGKLAKVVVQYLTPPRFSPGDAELDVLAALLTEGKTSRLVRALQYEEQLVQSVRAYQQSMANVSVFSVEAIVKDGVDPKAVLSGIQAQLEFLTDLPPEAEEIERAVNRIETDVLFGLQKLGGFSGKAEQLQSYNHFTGDPAYLAQDLARYRAVTPDTLAAVVESHLAPEKRAVLVAWPRGTRPSSAADTTGASSDDSPEPEGATP
ncbi:MAG: M16 family metallopeptidase [Myxococcota bacterium]